jgi:hypothetical protein
MNHDDDAELASAIRNLSNEPVREFDPHDTAARATMGSGSPWWMALATTVAAIVLVVGGLAFAASLGRGRDVGQTSVATPGASTRASASAAPTASPPDVGITEEQAVAAARAAAPAGDQRDVIFADAGPSSALFEPQEFDFSDGIASDQWVWVVTLATGQQMDAVGSIVVVDYASGEVLGIMNFRS